MEAVEQEKYLLGAMLHGGYAELEAEDFYRPEHRKIYEAIRRLEEDGVGIDAATVTSELLRTRADEHLLKYLLSVNETEYTGSRAAYYAEAVKEAARLRELERLGLELTSEAKNNKSDSEELRARYEEKLIKQSKSATAEMAFECVHAAWKEYYRRKNREGVGISTGYSALDKLTGGLRNSDLIILAARPSMGKTALALNMAMNAAAQSTVLFMSLEMSRLQIGMRILSSLSSVVQNRIRDGQLSGAEEAALELAQEAAHELKLYVDDEAGLSIHEIKMRARRHKRIRGLDLLVIDYLQIVHGSKEYRGNRVQEVSEMSRELKSLARELDIPILCLSQLSRSNEMRTDKRPQLSDLRDSGSIEQDADIVLMLYRESYYDKETDETAAELAVMKNRNGATGVVNMRFIKEYVRFERR